MLPNSSIKTELRIFIFRTVKVVAKVNFPSVSFCKDHTYERPEPWFLDDIDNWKNTSAAYIKSWILNSTMSKEDLFTFIHHRTDDRQFPCDTVTGGGAPYSGYPCTFPWR